jgi:RNA polymerase sigma factor (sigma-70 family)
MTENDYEVSLLHSDHNRLIVLYQPIVIIIVRKYIGLGLFRRDDFDEIVQTVNERLLAKVNVIREQYNGSSLLKTYISSIIRNICLKMYDDTKRHAYLHLADDSAIVDPDSLHDRYAIEDEREAFRTVLTLFRKHRSKLFLLLKVMYRLPVSETEIREWFPQSHLKEAREIAGLFDGDYGPMTDGEIYRSLTPFLNRWEGKKTTHDALRKWIDSKLSEIITVLNGDPPTKSHSPESLKILIEDYFSPFLSS